ncbi:unnamed protein product [Sphagnum troendelagicum]|uniref:Translation initiation factor eIF2B subunit delta n=1 Tax=Sphagnum troendelagicum TaxID=128251 RepID=A0ABP0TUX0_9BRYO
MDARRRTVIDPKVRMVGFVTPTADMPAETAPGTTTTTTQASGLSQAPATTVSNFSPSPVIIPPPQKAAAPPVPVPSPGIQSRPAEIEYPSAAVVGSNPSDSLLASSSLPSSKTGILPGERLMQPLDLLAASMPAGTGTIGVKPGKGQPTSSSSSSAQVLPVRVGSVPKSTASKPEPQQATTTEASKPLKERTSKAERRAKQEAERAAKAAAKESGGEKATTGAEGGIGQSTVQKESKAQKAKKEHVPERKGPQPSEKKGTDKMPEKEKKKEVPAPRLQFDDQQKVAKAKRRSLVEQTETKNRVELFRHLPQYVHGTQLPALEAKFFHDDTMQPHPAVYQVGLQYLTGEIVGGNARCIAMLMALRSMILDYTTPAEKTLVRDLMARINNNVNFFITCRPLSISMGNAIRFLKARIAKLAVSLPEAEAKASLVAEIDKFMQEKIVFADKEIVKHAVTKIRDGDVLLTHGWSCVVEMILIRAKEMGKKFRVVVVDSRPKLEGKGLLRQLLSKNIQCTYTHMNASPYIMQEVTRVFLGASSVLSNGTVYSRVGTACVAMVAHAFSVPVMICCETYKFHERVQLDSITSNELGDPDALVKVPGRNDLSALEGWADNEHLQLLNLTYDATPADYVSMIITELGMVPPTSVPVILREYRKETTI